MSRWRRLLRRFLSDSRRRLRLSPPPPRRLWQGKLLPPGREHSDKDAASWGDTPNIVELTITGRSQSRRAEGLRRPCGVAHKPVFCGHTGTPNRCLGSGSGCGASPKLSWTPSLVLLCRLFGCIPLIWNCPEHHQVQLLRVPASLRAPLGEARRCNATLPVGTANAPIAPPPKHRRGSPLPARRGAAAGCWRPCLRGRAQDVTEHTAAL